MKNSFFDHLIEFNFSIGIIGVVIILCYLTYHVNITNRAEDKAKQQYMSDCVSKHTPESCSLGWKLAKQY